MSRHSRWVMSKSATSLEVLALRKQVNDLREAALAQQRVERALREAIEFHRATLEEVPFPLCKITGDERVLYANGAIADFLGYESRHELAVLLPVLGVFLDRTNLAQLRQVAPETPAYLETTGQFRRKDGSGCPARFRLQQAPEGSDYTIAILSRVELAG
jgi:PAS domain-containing protein